MVGGGVFDVILQRDAVTKPWGFRLQGGRESQQPLTIQRVFVGSSSDGRLQRGDIITAIEGQDAFRMYHHDAESLIQNARNMLTLTVQRGSANSYVDSTASDLGSSYYKAGGPTWSSGGAADGEVEDYSRTVSDIRQKFNSPPAKSTQKAGVIHMNPQPGMPSYIPKRPAIWTKKEPIGHGVPEMGWAPHLTQSRQQSAPSTRGGRQQYPGGGQRGGGPISPPVNRAPRHMTPPSVPASQEPYEPPAWAGSLKRSGGVRMWEVEEGEALARGGAPISGRRHSPPRSAAFVPHPAPNAGSEPVTPHNPRLQSVRYGPGAGGPTYEQHDPSNGSDSARVAHLQYNSPIGLYSRQNAQEALTAQTGGKAGHGTMQITGGGQSHQYNPVQSDVFRLVAEEDETRAMRQHGPPKAMGSSRQPQQQQHHQQQQQRYYDDGHHQSQHQQQYRGVESQFADMGISDF